jgi:Tfp pilus assembly protein PilX
MQNRRMPAGRGRQRGVVLMVALIVLVAMTLAGIALMRSVDTTTIIAGNLAFQQSATNSGDIGTETAVTWLVTNNSGTILHASITAQGYVARREDPVAGQSWDTFWNTVLDPTAGPSQVVKLAQNAATGNTVAYVIHRMCNAELDPTTPTVDCAQQQTTSTSTGSSKGAGQVALLYNSSIYYRITSRIAGPRNTVSYVQTIVSM